MDYMKIVGRLEREKAADQAVYYDNCGADELLFFTDPGPGEVKEEDIRTIKDIGRNCDIPLMVVSGVHRFEDAKKLIYAGAKTLVIPEWDYDPEAVLEACGRFGRDRLFLLIGEETSGADSDRTNASDNSSDRGDSHDNSSDRRDTPDNSSEKQETAADISEKGFGGIVFDLDPEKGPSPDHILSLTGNQDISYYVICRNNSPGLAKFLAETGACGVILDSRRPFDAMEVKQRLHEEGIRVNLFESAVSFDDFVLNKDGMIPCITQDYRTGEVLMLAYMTRESFEKTLKTGKMTYYSRSRQELWTKGDTSGHYQYVKSLSIDCDKDTLLAKVAQVGAACHTGNRTCFYTDLVKKETDPHNPLEVFQQVFDTILDRKEHPKEGSYTNYLFDKGIDKILKKVGEEATEIVIAAKNPDSGELKYEICDFLYHMMVLMAQRDVSWKEITDELAQRH